MPSAGSMPSTQPLDESHDGEWEWAGLVLRACTADGSNRDEEMGQLRAERDDAVERSESGMMQLHGTIIIHGEERLSEDAEKNQLEIA